MKIISQAEEPLRDSGQKVSNGVVRVLVQYTVYNDDANDIDR